MKISRWNFLINLFFIALFPSHLWMIFRAFIGADFVFEQSGIWSAVGVIAYQLGYAFLESVFIFILLVILSLSLPPNWDLFRRLSVVGGAYFIVAFWAIFRWQYFFLSEAQKGGLFHFMQALPGSILLYRVLFIGVVVLSVGWLIWQISFNEQKQKRLYTVFEKIKILGWFYLLLDIIGVIIIIIRNVA